MISYKSSHLISYVKSNFIITMRLWQNGHHVADIFKPIFFNENFYILIQISLKGPNWHYASIGTDNSLVPNMPVMA